LLFFVLKSCIKNLKNTSVEVCNVVRKPGGYWGAHRVDVSRFPESPMRRMCRKKIPEMTLKVPQVLSGFRALGQKVQVFRKVLREIYTEKDSGNLENFVQLPGINNPLNSVILPLCIC